MTTHTPGPWTLLAGEYDNGMSRKVIASDRDPRGASTFYAMIAGDAPCREANARLITAAPETLAFITRLATITGNPIDIDDVNTGHNASFRMMARTLLARIEGKE